MFDSWWETIAIFFMHCIWIWGKLISNFTHSELKYMSKLRVNTGHNQVPESCRRMSSSAETNLFSLITTTLMEGCTLTMQWCCSAKKYTANKLQWEHIKLLSLAHVQSTSDTVGIKTTTMEKKTRNKTRNHFVVSQYSLSGLHTGLSAWSTHTHTMKHLRGLWRLSTIDRWDSKPQFSAAPV